MGKERGEKKLPKKDEKQLITAGYLDGYILLYRIGKKMDTRINGISEQSVCNKWMRRTRCARVEVVS